MQRAVKVIWQLVLGGIAAIFCVGCHLLPRGAENEASVHQQVPQIVPLKIEGLLERPAIPPQFDSEVRIEGAKGLRLIQFADNELGWMSDKESIFMTVDGGTTWTNVSLGIPAGSFLTDLYFRDQLHGWVTIVTGTNADALYLGSSSQIWYTSDAGKSWVEQGRYEKGVVLKSVYRIEDQISWAIGFKMTDGKPPYAQIVALRTVDQGLTWNDLSDGFKSVTMSKDGVARDYGGILAWTSATDLFMLTTFNRLLTSKDGGLTWTLSGVIQKEDMLDPTSYYELHVEPNGKLRILGGAMATEGTWGTLIVREVSGAWMEYRLGGTFISDIVVLSEQEYIACGAMYDDSNTPNPRVPWAGVIIHTEDGGKSWRLVARSKQTATFNELALIGNSQVVAVGDHGVVSQVSLHRARMQKCPPLSAWSASTGDRANAGLRIQVRSASLDGIVGAFTFTCSYIADGRLEDVTEPTQFGGSAACAFDKTGQLTSETGMRSRRWRRRIETFSLAV